MTTSTPEQAGPDGTEGVADLVAAIRALDLATGRLRSSAALSWRVTVTDSLVMSHLAAGGAMTPGDLARSLVLSSGTMTTVLDRLEAAGYVRRVPRPDDRRSLHIELTGTGEQALSDLTAAMAPAIAAAVHPIDRESVRDTLRALAAALNETDLPSAAPG